MHIGRCRCYLLIMLMGQQWFFGVPAVYRIETLRR